MQSETGLVASSLFNPLSPGALPSDADSVAYRQFAASLLDSQQRVAPGALHDALGLAADFAVRIAGLQDALRRLALVEALRNYAAKNPKGGILAPPTKRGRKRRWSDEDLIAIAAKVGDLCAIFAKHAPQGTRVTEAYALRRFMSLGNSTKDRQTLKTVQNLVARGKRLRKDSRK